MANSFGCAHLRAQVNSGSSSTDSVVVHRFCRRAGVYTRLDYLPGGPAFAGGCCDCAL